MSGNTLILVRHAKSSWSHRGLADHDRPLNKRGQRDALRMGRRLARLGYNPRLLVSSSAERARTTAELIAIEIGYEPRGIEIRDQLYGSSPGEILGILSDWDDAVDCAMLVAHNPGTTDLVNYLTDAGISNIPTCGIAIMRSINTGWSDFSDTGAELLHYDYPRSIDD
jgi:phosphohistidine phosphatase